jgi:hypothetical protein
MNLDLIVARETIHEGQSLMANIVIDNLVVGLFFVNGDGVGDP